MKILENITFIGAGIGALFLLLGLTSSSGAPQEAAAAAMAIAFVAIPYCVTSVLQRREIMRRQG